MRVIFGFLATLGCMSAGFVCSPATAMTPEEFHACADTIINSFAEFDPVWGTNAGIHDYDARLADYSKDNVERYVRYLKNTHRRLQSVTTDHWPLDDAIDHQLLVSNIIFQLFQLETFPYWRKSPSVYTDQCLNGIYFLALRDFAPMNERLRSLIGRLIGIPAVMHNAEKNLIDPVLIFVETSMEAVDDGVSMINDVSQAFIDSFPDSADDIAIARDNAAAALRRFKSFCDALKPKATVRYAIGAENLNMLLSQVNFLDMGADSLLRLGENIFARADSEIKELREQLPPSDTTARFPIPSIRKQDLLEYYKWEIGMMKDYTTQSGIVSIPDGFGECIPMETPAFLRGIIRGIAYQQPAPLDNFDTGFFYVRPLPDTLTAAQKADYAAYIHRRGFRGSVVHEAYPGHHMQLLLAKRNKSRIRRIQENLILIEGWALYCEEMVYRQGLYGDDKRQWLGVLGGIRFRAARIILDINLQRGEFTPEAALAFMNEKLGENNYYYTSEIRRYCANPTQALSYLTGKSIIMEMRRRAMQKDSAAFDLKDFHDKLLSEGSIPPKFIAQKYGW